MCQVVCDVSENSAKFWLCSLVLQVEVPHSFPLSTRLFYVYRHNLHSLKRSLLLSLSYKVNLMLFASGIGCLLVGVQCGSIKI